MVFHMVQENQSFRSMICLSKIIKNVFGYSDYECSHTKSHAIVSDVFEPMVADQIKTEIIQTPFVCISTDSSNHKSTKLYPVMLRYFIATKGILTRLIELQEQPGETSEIIHKMLMDVIDEWDIRTEVVAFCADNCPTNFGSIHRGGQQNVFYRLQKDFNEKLIGIGCLMHTVHNALDNGCTISMPHDIEAVLTKIYKHFYIFTTRETKLKEWCDKKDIEFQRVKQVGGTRFIAMKNCIKSVLFIYGALVEYFNENAISTPVLLKNFFKDPLHRFILIFVHDVCKIFESTILCIEGDKITAIEAIKSVKGLMNLLLRHKEDAFISVQASSELERVLNESSNNSNPIEKYDVMIEIVDRFYGSHSTFSPMIQFIFIKFLFLRAMYRIFNEVVEKYG